MEKIRLMVERIQGKECKKTAFLVYDVDGRHDHVIGAGKGIRYAANNYVKAFNDAGYIDDNDEPIVITNDDIELIPRKERIVRYVYVHP